MSDTLQSSEKGGSFTQNQRKMSYILQFKEITDFAILGERWAIYSDSEKDELYFAIFRGRGVIYSDSEKDELYFAILGDNSLCNLRRKVGHSF